MLLGGLELVAAGYIIQKHSKNKRERQRVAEEYEQAEAERAAARARQPRRRHSDDYPQRPHHHHHDRKRKHDRVDEKRTASPSKPTLCSTSSLLLGLPKTKPQRAGSAPPPNYHQPAPVQAQWQPRPYYQHEQQMQAPFQHSTEPAKHRPLNQYPLPPPPTNASAPATPLTHQDAFFPYHSTPPTRAETRHPLPPALSNSYIAPPEGVWELPSGDLQHPNPAGAGQRRSSRPSPHVHFEDDMSSTGRHSPPPPYQEFQHR